MQTTAKAGVWKKPESLLSHCRLPSMDLLSFHSCFLALSLLPHPIQSFFRSHCFCIAVTWPALTGLLCFPPLPPTFLLLSDSIAYTVNLTAEFELWPRVLIWETSLSSCVDGIWGQDLWVVTKVRHQQTAWRPWPVARTLTMRHPSFQNAELASVVCNLPSWWLLVVET